MFLLQAHPAVEEAPLLGQLGRRVGGKAGTHPWHPRHQQPPAHLQGQTGNNHRLTFKVK